MERYEHHTVITQNRFCPFKLGRIVENVEDVFNWHKNIEFILVTDGEGFIRYGTDEIHLEKGDVFLVSSNIMHRLYSPEKFEFYYFIIDEGFCLENCIDVSKYYLEPKVCDEELNALYFAMAERFKARDKEDNPLAVLGLRAAVLDLLFYVFSHYAKPIEKDDAATHAEQFIKKAVIYLGEHYTENITLEDIASYCGVSRFHLAREFKSHTGQTLFEYVNMLRCKKATLMLSEGMSVTETAYACGYESLSYFSRVYRKRMGVSPSNLKA